MRKVSAIKRGSLTDREKLRLKVYRGMGVYMLHITCPECDDGTDCEPTGAELNLVKRSSDEDTWPRELKCFSCGRLIPVELYSPSESTIRAYEKRAGERILREDIE